MKTKKITNILIIALIAAGYSIMTIDANAQKNPKVKNIILLIGDGMGVAQVYAGMSVADNPLNIVQFPYSGFLATFSADNYITDSAAGGTAISSGEKTNNGMIGVRPDSTDMVPITAIVQKAGLATGVLSTSAITHATPASFVAHDPSRDNYEAIAEDFLNGTADVFIGGGLNHFSKRKDGRDLTAELKEKGYEIVTSLDALKASQSPKIAGLLAPGHMPTVAEGRKGQLDLMTRKAIEVLSKDKDGFFLMVEGSMIDWGGHANDINYVTSEMIDFDEAVGAALQFAKTNKNTLVVVTADHETGGLNLTGDEDAKGDSFVPVFATTGHTGVMVPIFSYGPGAERFSGIHDNTYFFNAFQELLRLRK